MKKLIISLILLACEPLVAQTSLAVYAIPANIKQNANAVIRFDNTDFYIESIGSSVTKRHWAVTIFNEKGEEDYAYFEAHYDDFSKIKKIEGELFDEFGKSLKKLKSSDIRDIGYGRFTNDVTDGRMKVAEFSKKYYPYPYTVEFSFEEESSNMMFYPSWEPISEENVGLESSSFNVYSLNNIPYRKIERSLSNTSIKSHADKYALESWSIKNVEPLKFEEFSLHETLPFVQLAPSEFKVKNYQGTMRTWEDISKFYYILNKDRDQIDAETIAKLKKYIGAEKDEIKRIKLTYEFMQSMTRYVSIQLGIGGWQTLLATEVATKGYGDCKALTNFTIALLKTEGIKAYPALINAGEGEHFENQEFPSMRFNHVIACVPVKNDTIWLECTSQTGAFGYQGDFTGNRKALLVKNDGGRLVNTKAYLPTDNLQIRKIKAEIDANGDAKIISKTVYTGIQHETRANLYETKNVEDQKTWLQKSITLGTFDLTNFEGKRIKNRIPELHENIEISAKKLASTSGPRMFIKANLLSGFIEPDPQVGPRKNMLFLNPNSYSFCDIDTIAFNLPAGYKPEHLGKTTHLEEPFGSYHSEIKQENEQIFLYRSLCIKGGMYKKENFETWLEFCKTVNKIDKQKMVLIKTQ